MDLVLEDLSCAGKEHLVGISILRMLKYGFIGRNDACLQKLSLFVFHCYTMIILVMRCKLFYVTFFLLLFFLLCAL